MKASSRTSPATRQNATFVLIFRFVGGGVSAEQFEALLAMALFTRQARGVQPLSSVYDAAKPASVGAFVAAMQSRIGPLRGAPTSWRSAS